MKSSGRKTVEFTEDDIKEYETLLQARFRRLLQRAAISNGDNLQGLIPTRAEITEYSSLTLAVILHGTAAAIKLARDNWDVVEAILNAYAPEVFAQIIGGYVPLETTVTALNVPKIRGRAETST